MPTDDTTAQPRTAGSGAVSSSLTPLRIVAAVSCVYDLLLAGALSFGRPTLAAVFGVAAPAPPIHADLNVLFTAVVGIGYVLPWRDPVRYRAYLWLMGPLLKGGGAVLFVFDVALRGSPASFLLFALADGAIAALTFWALRRTAR